MLSQLPVGDGGVAVPHRDRLGPGAGLLAYQLPHHAVGGVGRPFQRRRAGEGCPLLGGQRVQAADQGGGVLRGGQQSGEVPADPFDGGAVQEVRVVLEGVARALVLLDDLEGQVELALLVDAFDRAGQQRARLIGRGVAGPVLEVEGDVERCGAAARLPRAELGCQVEQRIGAVLQRLQHGAVHPANQSA